MIRLVRLVVAVIANGSFSLTVFAAAPQPVDFQRQIAPLLAEHCYECHGANERKRQGDLRLDSRSAASDSLPTGSVAIVPGKPAQSELMRRVTSADPELRMPPPGHGRALAAEEIDRLRHWIAAGANWSEHWSFVRPRKTPLPAVNHRTWPRNPLDYFIAARYETEGLTPAASAPRAMLARRAALVLTGLPPSSEQLREFLADDSPDAYQRYLDRLFDSPQYGEQMAAAWLDLARYADTHGFHTDSHRDMWRWRDEVIAAYNRHQPLDQFITEQLAGDLLPQATLSQRIASGFHRNGMINFENGALAEEYRNLYVVDRVNTTATAFLGLTVACAQCHDHKYDSISQREYYSLYAFFNNVPEEGLDGKTGNAAPLVKAPTWQQQLALAGLDREIATAQQTLERRAAGVAELTAVWEKSQGRGAGAATPGRGERGEGSELRGSNPVWRFSLDERGEAEAIVHEERSNQAYGAAFGQPLFLPAAKYRGGLLLSAGSGIGLKPPVLLRPPTGMTLSLWVYPTTDDRMVALTLTETDRWELGVERGRPFARVVRPDGTAHSYTSTSSLRRSSWSHLLLSYSEGEEPAGKIYLNGVPLEITTSQSRVKPAAPEGTEPRLTMGSLDPATAFKGMLDEVRGYDHALSADEVAELFGSDPIAEIVKLPPALRSEQQQQRLRQYYLTQIDPPYRQAQEALRAASTRRETLLRTVPTSMVMQELPQPRVTHLLLRGDYRQPGPVVQRATPAVLHDWPADAPLNRLGLAQWLVDPANPLTARVIVNRHWMQIFGQPLVATPEDFGLRGAPPTHPELLDWLAVELIESGWDLQRLQRLMLTSATFRQTSQVTAEQRTADPLNRCYTRFSRTSLTGEQVRDAALAAGGLLDRRIGGQSVFPYQPEGLWEAISYDPREFTAQTYTQSHGADLYRRSLYTFWKRSLPPPALAAFGAPTRELCTVQRSTSMTPQQALVVWNDPTYLEAARQAAARVLGDLSIVSDQARVERLYQIMLSRLPSVGEQQVINDLLREQARHFRAHPAEARELLSVGESKPGAVSDPPQQAAWTIAAQTIMMTDEFLSRP